MPEPAAVHTPGAPPTATALPRPREVTAALSERVLTLDPANHFSISTTAVLRHIFDPLVDVTSDSIYVPALAEAWEVVDDLTWKFTLRQGVRFHDGSPFNADSVIYTLTRVRDDPRLVKWFGYQDVAAVERDGDYGVIVRTVAPFGSLLGSLTMLGMLPPSARGREEAFFARPVGTGPFRLVSWTRGEQVALEANETYWRSGSPTLSKVGFRFVPEIAARAAGLRSGEFDIIDRVPVDLLKTFEAIPGIRVLTRPTIETQQWVFHHARPPTDIAVVRKAISLAIDRTAIVEEFQLGLATAATCPTPPNLIGHVDLGAKPYNPSEARALLKDAGLGSLAIDFVLMKGLYNKQLEIAQAVAGMLGQVGIFVDVKDLDVAAARQLRASGDFHLFYSGWTHMPHDPDLYFSQWFSRAGAASLSRYSNPVVDTLIADARSTDPSVRQAKYEALQRILWEDEEATIWPYYNITAYAVRDHVVNFDPRPDYYVLLTDVAVA